jgi:uncharacterized membrane protein YhaH (DUF805 family)
MVTFGEAIRLGYSNSFNFSGFSTRAEYWWFFLFNILVAVVMSVMAGIVPPLALLSILFALITLPANLSILFRRIRDAGGSIYWILAMWGAAIVQVGLLISMIGSMDFSTPNTPNTMMEGPMLIVSGVYMIAGLVCFVYTLLPSKS